MRTTKAAIASLRELITFLESGNVTVTRLGAAGQGTHVVIALHVDQHAEELVAALNNPHQVSPRQLLMALRELGQSKLELDC